MSADSIVPDAFDGQAHNAYSYVLNNPVRYVDPTGHAADDAGDRGGGVDADRADAEARETGIVRDGGTISRSTNYGPNPLCGGGNLYGLDKDPKNPNRTDFGCGDSLKSADTSKSRNGSSSGLDAASRAKIAEMPRDPSCSVLVHRTVLDGTSNPYGGRALSAQAGSRATTSTGWQEVTFSSDAGLWGAFSMFKGLVLSEALSLVPSMGAFAARTLGLAGGTYSDGLALQRKVEYDSLVVSEWFGVVDSCITRTGPVVMMRHYKSGPSYRATLEARASYRVVSFGSPIAEYGPEVLFGGIDKMEFFPAP